MLKLDDLAPTVVQNTTEIFELYFTCPTCRKARISIPFRIGNPRHEPPHAWGADSIDTAKMSIEPSVANAFHGRIRCIAHVVITGGYVFVK